MILQYLKIADKHLGEFIGNTNCQSFVPWRLDGEKCNGSLGNMKKSYESGDEKRKSNFEGEIKKNERGKGGRWTRERR